METFHNPGIVIKRIKETSLSVKELLFRPEEHCLSEIGMNFGLALEKNLIDFTITAFYHYPHSTDRVAEITVQNVYEIPGITQYQNNHSLNIPPLMLMTLVGMSISHTRALFAKALAGTMYNDAIFPLIDVEEITKHFFPYVSFDGAIDTTGNIKKEKKRN